MNNRIFCSISLAFLLITALPSWGEQIKAYVSPCSVTGGANKDEMKAALQTLLMSRLTGEKILAVDSSAGSDIAIACSYVVFGKIYSIDAVAKNSSGSVIARGFAQGEGQDDLIPAIGKLAKALTDDIVAANVVVTAPKMPPADVDRTKKTSGDIVRKDTIAPPRGDIVRAAEIEKSGGSGWVSQRLGGTMTNIAIGRTLENGEREIFISEDHSLRFYRQGKDLKLIAEVPLGIGKKILAVDTADLDGDGIPEVYVTIMEGNNLVSQVWVPESNSLKLIADNLHYFFRSIAFSGKEKKIYSQEKDLDGNYYGDVLEMAKNGARLSVKLKIKLPKFGNIYNFSMFIDGNGKNNFILFNPDGYLVVYSPELVELWRSSDKFGGTELYFDLNSATNTLTPQFSKKAYIDQRITVTREDEIIVPQNSGFIVVGDFRQYTKSSLVSMAWNGSALEERWRTKQSQNYMADYAFDERAKEVLLLEVVLKKGFNDNGASAVYLKKID